MLFQQVNSNYLHLKEDLRRLKTAAEEAEIRLPSPQSEKHYKAVQKAVPQEDEKGKHSSDSPQPFINQLRKHQNSFPDCLLSCTKIGAKSKISQIQAQTHTNTHSHASQECILSKADAGSSTYYGIN